MRYFSTSKSMPIDALPLLGSNAFRQYLKAMEDVHVPHQAAFVLPVCQLPGYDYLFTREVFPTETSPTTIALHAFMLYREDEEGSNPSRSRIRIDFRMFSFSYLLFQAASFAAQAALTFGWKFVCSALIETSERNDCRNGIRNFVEFWT